MATKRGPKPRKPKTRTPAASGPWSGFQTPPDLPENARAEMRRLVERLKSAGTFDRSDPAAVVSLARVTALLDAAFAAVESEGIAVTAHNGVEMLHPQLKAANALLLRQKALQAALGLLPDGKADAPASPASDDKWGNLIGVVG